MKKEEAFMNLQQGGTLTHFGINASELQRNFQTEKMIFMDEIIKLYFEERISSLQLISLFIVSCKNYNNYFLAFKLEPEIFRPIFDKLDSENDLIQNAFEGFKIYTPDYRIVKQLYNIEIKERHSKQILKEQVGLLECILYMCLYNQKSREKLKDKLFDMLDYFSSKNFNGYFHDILNDPHQQSKLENQLVYANIIKRQCTAIILYALDLNYIYYLDNKIELHTTLSRDNSSVKTSRMPFSLYKSEENFNKMIKFFNENLNKNNTYNEEASSIFWAFLAIHRFIEKWVREKKLSDSKPEEKEIIDTFFKIQKYEPQIKDLSTKINKDITLDFLITMFAPKAKPFTSDVTPNRLIIKTWLNLVISYVFNYEKIPILIDLCLATLNSDYTTQLFWEVDSAFKTPLATYFDSLIQGFPIGFDYLLRFCFILKGDKYSDKIYEKLKNMNKITANCKLSDFICLDEFSGIYKARRPLSMNYLSIEEGQEGKLISKNGNEVSLVFEKSFSLFEFLEDEWVNFNHFLYMSSNKSATLKDFRNLTTSEFIQLFCELSSDNFEILKNYLLEKPKEYMNEDDISKQYLKLLILLIETLNLITNDADIYIKFKSLTYSIYKLIYSLLRCPDKEYVISCLIENFISNFDSNKMVSNQNISMNLVNILIYTFRFDDELNFSDNSILVMKIINMLFRYTDIYKYANDRKVTEFLYTVFRVLICNKVESLAQQKEFKREDEFTLMKQILKVVNKMFKFISYGANKAAIISISQNEIDFFILIINCLNSFEITKLLMRIMQTNIISHQDLGVKIASRDKYKLQNAFMERLVVYSLDFNSMKKKVRGTIRQAFKCFNYIFDLLLSFKNMSDEMKIKYGQISTLRMWWDEIFLSKNIPTFDSSDVTTRETYINNLILQMFAYINFEFDEGLQFKIKKNYDYKRLDSHDIKMNIENTLDVIFKIPQSESNLNVCCLALNCLSRIVQLLKQVPTNIDSVSSTLNKVPVLLNFLSLKKESTSNIISDNKILLFTKYKDQILFNLSEGSYALKIEIIKFLSVCANSQSSFIIQLLENSSETKIHKNFWEIFFSLYFNKLNQNRNTLTLSQQQEFIYFQYFQSDLLGYMTIFLNNIFYNEIVYKKQIKDLIINFRREFEPFLFNVMRKFTKERERDVIDDTRRNFHLKNLEGFGFEKKMLRAQNLYRFVCFENIIFRSLCLIFSKLIILSDSKNRFTLPKPLREFLEINITNFLKMYSAKLNNQFMINFNRYLGDDKSFIKNIFSSKYDNFKDKIISIKTYERSISIDEDFYLGSIFESVVGFNHSYWVDLRDLFFTMSAKSYDINIFFEFMPKFFEHNLELALFETKTAAMISLNYLIGFIFSLGIGDAFKSSYLFSNKETYDAINSSEKILQFANNLIIKNSSDYPKVGFNIITDLYDNNLNDLVKFLDEKLLKKNWLELLDFNISDEIFGENQIPSRNYNFYDQYIYYKYYISNHICDYLNNYLYKKYREKLQISSIHKYLIQTLIVISKDCSYFTKNLNKNSEFEKTILSIINLIYSIITFLNQTEYEFVLDTINIVNSIVNWLIQVYELIPTYNAIIIFILNAYSSIDYFGEAGFETHNVSNNIIFNSQESKIINLLLKKLASKPTEQEYLAIITLFYKLMENYDMMLDKIMKDKILVFLNINDRFANIQINEYEENERGVNHILWCWTLIFLKQVCLKIHDSKDMKFNNLLYVVIEFVRNHSDRITKVLESTEYLDVMGNYVQKTLAYLEELEYTISLLSALMIQSSKWKNYSNDYLNFCNKYLTILFSITMKLFMPNIKISNHYKSNSNVEKTMLEVTLDESPSNTSNIEMKDHVTSILSPTKRKQPLGNITFNQPSNPIVVSPQRKESLDPTKRVSYIPNLFFYRIDRCLNEILFNISAIFQKAILFERNNDKSSYPYHIIYSYNTSNLKIFDDQCQNLLYGLYFTTHALENMIKNRETLKTFHQKSLVFFNNIISSVNFGNLNLYYTESIFIF